MISRFAAASLFSLSVTIRFGAHPSPFSNFLKKRLAASLSLRFCKSNVDCVAVLIHGTPKVVALPLNGDDVHLVEQPDVTGTTLASSQTLCVSRAEVGALHANGFVRDRDTALGEQVFYVTQAECESVIQIHRLGDDLGRKVPATIKGA